MRLFLSEFVCGGGWPDGVPTGSLRREGEGMLCAVAEDFGRLPGNEVTVTWDSRLGPFPIKGVRVVSPATPGEELKVLAEESAAADATLVIAPEFHDFLARRAEIVLQSGGRLLGSDPETLRLCGDKLALSRHLARWPDVACLATEPLPSRAERSALPFPVVIKPRHGASSTNTFLIRDAEELERRLGHPFDPPDLPPDVWQPFVAGRSLSVAALVHEAGHCDIFPVGEQRLSEDGCFRYLGGVVPARGVDPAPVEALICRLMAALPGLRGYVGFDVVLPHAAARHPVLVEINPRLTTSYLGYRQLADENLAGRWLTPSQPATPIHWRSTPVRFDIT